MERITEEMKNWLFDLAHGNISDEQILQGFVKHYILWDLGIQDVVREILYHTMYGNEGAVRAKESLTGALKVLAAGKTNEGETVK